MNTCERLKNKEELSKRFSGSIRLDRTKSEVNHIHSTAHGESKISAAEKEMSTDKDKQDRRMLSKNAKRQAPQRVSTLFMSPEVDWVKEQEKMVKLRKKVTQKYNYISANLKANIENEAYKYIVLRGNNSEVIKRCMRCRVGWEETAEFNTMFNFKWQQSSNGIKFNQISINGKKQMVNHFEHHSAITTKDNLFKNLNECLDNKVFEFVPLTF